MLVAENCFCETLEAPVRQIRARVELLEGSTLLDTFKYTDRLISFDIERVGEGKFFGFGICQKLNVKLMDIDRSINITTANTLDIAYGSGCDYIYPHPLFKVSEVRRDENTNELSITAYDYLYPAAGLTTAQIELSEYNIKTYAAAVALQLGLNCVFTGFKDEAALYINYPNGANLEGTETLRETLNAIAEATQSIYYINRDLELVFKRLDMSADPVLTIGKEQYFTLDSKTNRRLGQIVHTTELGDNISVSTAAAGTTQFIRDNPFYNMRDDVDILLKAALSIIGGLTINQFNCEWRGNYLLEIGDKIALQTKDNETVISYLLNDVIRYDGSYAQNSEWSYTGDDTETDANPVSLGDALKQTYAKVDKVNRDIALLASETDANRSNIAALQMNTESIVATVNRVETSTNASIDGINENIATLTNKVNTSMTAEAVKISIQEELANGVDKVYTSTGFAFDADGLRISKSGSEMETTLDEDGLTVYRDDTEVLTADNTGVNGINMTVRQYLIVGGSRFEAYGAGRTGCFWIG